MEQIAKLKTAWNLAQVFQIVQKFSEKKLPLLISINWPSLVGYWVVVQTIYSKMHPVSHTNTHHITDLVNHGMVQNTKTWISREWNITFLWNKNSNPCLILHILRSYRFVVEITFNVLLANSDHWCLLGGKWSTTTNQSTENALGNLFYNELTRTP